MAIYLNIVSGSRELDGCAIEKAITAMAMRLAHARRLMQDTDKVSVELTLLLPGKEHKPGFQGMRMTGYSADDATLYMESVIPESFLHSELADQYISALLQDAVENAAGFFADKGMSFSHAQWLGDVLLNQAEQKLH